MALELRALTLADEAAFLAGARAWDGEDLTWYSFSWQPGDDYAAHLQRLADNAAGRDLPAGHVAGTMLYGFVAGEIVGRVSIRHQLNDYLRRRGGHIGYSVAPPYRRRGHATAMFTQSLEHCRTLGLSRLLITCSDDNLASIRMIERAGGMLEDTVADPDETTAYRRYWLALT